MWMLAAMDIDLGTPIEEWEIYMLLIYCFECAWDLVHGESKTCPLCLLNHHKLKLTVKGRSPRRKTCIVSIGVWSLIHSQIVEIQWHFKVMEAIIWYMWCLWLLNIRLLEEKIMAELKWRPEAMWGFLCIGYPLYFTNSLEKLTVIHECQMETRVLCIH